MSVVERAGRRRSSVVGRRSESLQGRRSWDVGFGIVDGRAPVRNFRDLEVWQLGKRIVIEVYAATKRFPGDELYGLIAQMRRAAVSCPSNIAEGFSRSHRKEYRQFLYVALGSCAELETQVEVSCELGYFDATTRTELIEMLQRESRMLTNLIKRLE